MKQTIQRLGFVVLLITLIIALATVMFWALSIGSGHLSLKEIYDTLVLQLQSDTPIETVGKGPVHDIVWLLRFPRLVLAAIVGCGLAVSGVIMQAIVKKPLADPYILGISSGASLGATAAILLGVGAAFGENFVGIAAFLGAFGISLAVLLSRIWEVARVRSNCSWPVWRSARFAARFRVLLCTLPTTRKGFRVLLTGSWGVWRARRGIRFT